MLFDRYSDEAQFRSAHVRPLLTRLGFISVAELHGAQEFGKDFVFSELTPFGFLRHYAAVVKHQQLIRQSSHSVCDTILAQVQQAFSISFRLPDTDAEHRVGSVVVFNSGKITENARLWLRAELDERYGRNVHILDGERLFQLDLSAAFRQGQEILPRLQGILNDIHCNLAVWRSISSSLPVFSEGRGCFTLALEQFMAAPFLTDRISLNDVVLLIQECRIIERINSRYLTPLRPKEERRQEETATLQSVIVKASVRAEALQRTIATILGSFRLLTSAES